MGGKFDEASPKFSPDGKWVAYCSNEAGKPSLLWEGHYSQGMSSSCGPPGVSSASYDVTSDDKRFLMVKDIDQDASSTSIVVVLNWTEELKRLEQDLRK